ncbi:nucleoside phosphatase family-domain-containing protein [Pisolithus marmoratus]|nr:nucleoside phosphatase family-domain-containing protein [Pisolithus marmoratus]
MAASVFARTPRNNYERLESGVGPAHATRKIQWKKIALGCTVLITLVWLFSPRGELYADPTVPQPLPEDVYTTKTPLGSHHDVNTYTTVPPSPASPAPTADSTPFPTSPETDPDPLKTVHCTTPHTTSSPLVQYALMIDAGSTGSRIHIYKFHNCGPTPAFEYEVFKQIQPGLSSFAGNPQAAAESLDVLLQEAERVVPETLWSCTPVAVKATAGLRLLGARESGEILEAVQAHLEQQYRFAVPQRDGVVIMDGKDEGVYAWITANYLLDTIRADSPADVSPYAVLDLGGGSTQIVFEPEREADLDVDEDEPPREVLKEGDHKYDFGHSYLGYGLKSARGSVHRLVEFMDSIRRGRMDDNDEGNGGRIPNPCLARGTEKEVEIPLDNGHKKTVVMVGADIGGFEACSRVLELVMAKDAVCELKPCSFDGVYQPSLLDAFPTGKILLLSYFYDRVTPLTKSDNGPLTISVISQLATQVCAGPSSWREHWGNDADVIEELEGRPEWCLDLSFMHALLVLGYEFGESREVELGKRIQGTELGWCLGATIAMVGGGEIRCRA